MQIQAGMVRLSRNALNWMSRKDRKALPAVLEFFTESDWGRRFPTVPALWQRQWGTEEKTITSPAKTNADSAPR